MTTVTRSLAQGRSRRAAPAAPAQVDDRVLELVHHRRPQEDRHPLRRTALDVLRVRRRRGAAHPSAARPAQRHRAHRGAVQHDVHDARHHHGVPGGHAARGRVRQLLHPAADRRPRRRVPRLNMFGYWVVLFGGLFMYSSFFLGGAPNGGWFGYTPLTSTPISGGALPGTAPTSGASASRCSASGRPRPRSTSSSRSSTCARRG